MHSASADDSKGNKRRGPVSCAECRRLKLKCDRRLPCTSCSKRGCAAICPNGTLAAGPGNRFVLADTQHLHDKIDSMAKRIAELEDALASLAPPGDVHPLLSDDLLRIKALPNTENVTAAIQQQETNGTDGAALAEFFGTLKIGDRPEFFGPTAGADYLTQRPYQPEPDTSLPLDVLLLSSTFPFTRLHDVRSEYQRRIGEWMPPRHEARGLVENYYTDADWMFRVIPRDELLRTLFNRVYAGQMDGDSPPQYDPEAADSTAVSPHELAVLLMVIAQGYHFEQTKPPYNVEAQNCYQLARVALGLDPIDDHPTIAAVRALHLMSTFVQYTDTPNSGTACYVLIGLAAQLARSLGLHRDDSRWQLSEQEQQIRRNIFWDVATFEYFSALSFGRPSSWSPSQVDAKLPIDVDRFPTEDGVGHASFRMWVMTFTQTRLMKVMDQAFGITPLTHATVMRLDKYIKDQPISDPVRLVHIGRPDDTNFTTGQIMQRHICFILTHKVLLYLHRAYLAQAIIEHPDDPLKSKYAGNVLAAYRSAFYISACVRALRAQLPICVKTWAFWTYAYSAFVVLCSIVIRSPGSGLAPPAFKELELCYATFDGARSESKRVDGVMSAMTSLLHKARHAWQQFEAMGQSRLVCTEAEATHLGFLWGHTRTIEEMGDTLSVHGTSPFANIHRSMSKSSPVEGLTPLPNMNNGGHANGPSSVAGSGSSLAGSMSPPSLPGPMPSPPAMQASPSSLPPVTQHRLRTQPSQASMELDAVTRGPHQRILRSQMSMEFEAASRQHQQPQQSFLRSQPSLGSVRPGSAGMHLLPSPLPPSTPDAGTSTNSHAFGGSNQLPPFNSVAYDSSYDPNFSAQQYEVANNQGWYSPGHQQQSQQPIMSVPDHFVDSSQFLRPAGHEQTQLSQQYAGQPQHPSVQVQPPPASQWQNPQQQQQQQQQYGIYYDTSQQQQQPHQLYAPQHPQQHPHHMQQKQYLDTSAAAQGQQAAPPPPLPASLDTTWNRFVEEFASPAGAQGGAYQPQTQPHR